MPASTVITDATTKMSKYDSLCLKPQMPSSVITAEMDLLRDEQTTLGGRPAWVSTFRMHFRQRSLKATDELIGVALVDVGRPQAAILYVSIPGTHRDFDWVVDSVLNSVRPTG